MKNISVLITFLLVVLLSACSSEEKKSDKSESAGSFMGHKVTVEEVIHTKTYTYLKVVEDDEEKWLAISRRETEVGETLYWTEALEMKNFESKELERTFETVYFIQNISSQATPIMPEDHAKNLQGRKPKITKETVSVDVVKGGVTIAELFANPQNFDGKKIIVKGKITKFNKEIMQKNWAHLQDGTSDGDNFDLTITTLETVRPGDIVTFKGKITLDKDFGYGYSYKILMEDAEIIDNQAI